MNFKLLFLCCSRDDNAFEVIAVDANKLSNCQNYSRIYSYMNNNQKKKEIFFVTLS